MTDATFLLCVAASRLIDDATLSSLRGSFIGDSASDLADYLVAKSALTRWQADQLLLGRYKGFFVDRYKLVDHVGDTNLRIRYLAEDLQTKKMVVLAMMPKRAAGPPQYLVEEQGSTGADYSYKPAIW